MNSHSRKNRSLQKFFSKHDMVIISLIILIIFSIFPFFFLNAISAFGLNVNTKIKNFQETEENTKYQVGLLSSLPPTDKIMLLSQLRLDSGFNISEIGLFEIENLERFDILIVAGMELTSNDQTKLQSYLASGGSLLILPGKNATNYRETLLSLDLIPITASSKLSEDSAGTQIFDPVNDDDPLVQQIRWETSPEAQVYQIVSSFNSEVIPIVKGYRTGIVLVFRAVYENGKILGINLIYTEADNPDFQVWPYLPYTFYCFMSELVKLSPESYANWTYSPVPHTSERFWLIIYLVFIFIIGYGAFFFARSRSHKPIETKYLQAAAEIKHKKLEEITIDEIQSIKEDSKSIWEKIGLPRQISSFFLYIVVGFIAAIPYFLGISYIYPRFVNPYPQVQGWINWTSSFFSALFLVFDLGTSTALTKFFSEYRISNPAKAIRYAQIYIWWQILTGCIQITIVSSLGAYFLSSSYLGHMTWFFILSSFAQFPGMINAILLIMEAMQRFDIKITLEIVLNLLVVSIIQYITILICRDYFGRLAQYGQAFGAGVGYILGGHIAGILNFFVYMWFFKRMGFSTLTLFRVDFDKSNLKEALIYGSKLAAGNVWVPLGGLLEILLISTYVLAYNSEMGYLSQMKNITIIAGAAGAFFSNIMPAISEAHGNGKLKLTEYYIIEGIKWGNFLTFFMIAVLFAYGDKLLLGFAGYDWYGSLKYLPYLVFFAIWEPWAWLTDRIFQGTNNTGYNLLVWIIEQGTRAILLFFMLPRFQLAGLYYAYIPAIIFKDIAAFILIRKKISKFDWNWMHTFIAPLISSLIIYGIFRPFVNWLWNGTLFVTIVLFIVIFFGGIFFYSFLTGFFGGWDDNVLEEFVAGLNMVKSVKFLFSSLATVVKVGHHLCPWRNRFPVYVFEKAVQEAAELTEIKRKLII